MKSNSNTSQSKKPIVPQLQLNKVKQFKEEENSSSDCEQSQEDQFIEPEKSTKLCNNPYDNMIQTWRSIESTLLTSRDGLSNSNMQQQILELTNQISQLMNFHQQSEQIKEQEEQETKMKVIELINNLEAKNLKISEQNKQLLNEIMGGTLGKTMIGNETLGALSIGKYTMGNTHEGIAMGNTLALLETLNHIIQEEQNEEELFLQEQCEEQEKIIQEQSKEIEQLQLTVKVLKQQMDQSMNQFEKEKSLLNQEIQILEQQIKNNNTNERNTNKNQLAIEMILKEFTLDNIMNKEKFIDQLLKDSSISKLQTQLKMIVSELRKSRFSGKCYKNSTMEVFRKQLRRTSSLEKTKFNDDNGLQEPTPRFIFDNHNQTSDNIMKQQLSFDNTNQSVFQANLSLNRSLVNGQSRVFNSTLNNLFRKRPSNGDQNKELWNYISELEKEIIDLQASIKNQNDQSQLEISMCLGNNEAAKNLKFSLEQQIEELAQDNMLKTQKIANMENFNNNLIKVLNQSSMEKSENEEEQTSFMINLKGILSPKQFKKIKVFLENEELMKKNIDYENGEQQLTHNNLGQIFDNQNLNSINQQDSKNTTLSFRKHGIHLNDQSSSIPNISQQLISPVCDSRKQHFFNQPIRKSQNNLMLIQDQLNHSGYDCLDRSIGDEQFFLNQPSMIIDNQYQGMDEQPSQFLNTQNNKTLQSFLNLNQSKITSANNSKGQFFGFKKKFHQESMLNKSNNTNKSFQGGQTVHFMQQMHDNYQTQLQELKDEKIKLIQILNKFLNLPNDTTVNSLEEILQNTSQEFLPSKQYFEDFRMQVTQALSQQQFNMTSIEDQQQKVNQEKEHLKEQQEKMEKKRLQFNEKVKKLKEKNEDIVKKLGLLDEREKLLEQQEQKLKFRKSAIDEEWKRLDKKREDLKSQEEIIQKEWEKLGKEVKEVNDMRRVQKEKKMELKEMKAKIDAEKRIIENQQEKLIDEAGRLEEALKKQKLNERKMEREIDRINKMKDEMSKDKIEIEKQKEFIKQERSHIEQERQELEQKRSLSGMFIPDLKNLVSKMSTKHKSLNRTYIAGDCGPNEESRIKQQYKSNIVTNMNAYINKCQCGNTGEGIFNCDLHKTMNKSTISLSNICNYHSQQPITAIGSGRPTYKNNNNNASSETSNNSNNLSKFSITKALRDQSFKRNVMGNQGPQSAKNLNSTFKFPKMSNISIIGEDKENMQPLNNGLESILKGTAKFKESRNKLEQSYNSLMESIAGYREDENDGCDKNPLMDTQYSFMSFDDGNIESGQSLSKDEL